MTRHAAFLYLVLVLVAGLTYACVTEYQPETKTLPPTLVVEGSVTDQPGPYTVRLTRTADYTQAGLNLIETGATVVIADAAGPQETLTETSPGSYQTRTGGLQGVDGHRYTLIITTKDGKRYQSDTEQLTAAPPITKLYYEYRADPTAISNGNIQGWDVYLDTKDPETPGDFYRWNWVHYEPILVCQQTEQLDGTYIGADCCSPCWDITRAYSSVNIKSDVAINGNTISRQLIARVPYTSRSMYYIEVQQQRLSAGGYAFWQSVKTLTQNNGGLFDAAPTTVRGNLRCTSDATTAVYGYFGATGLSEGYLYIDRSDAVGEPPIGAIVKVPEPSACVACVNSAYRTANKPRWWKN